MGWGTTSGRALLRDADRVEYGRRNVRDLSDLLHALGLTPTYVTESHTPHGQLADLASSTHMAHHQRPVAVDIAIFLSSWSEDILHRGIISWPYRRHVTSWPYHNRIVVYPSLMCMCMWPSVCVSMGVWQ